MALVGGQIRKAGRALIAAVLMLTLAPGAASGADRPDPDTVVWAFPHLPPYSITEGQYDRRGVAQVLTDLIAARTPTLRHTSEAMTFNRMLGLARAGRTLCSTFLVKTIERESFLTFGEPLLRILPNRLFLARGRLQRWAEGNGEVDLESAFARGLKVAVARGRFHNDVIDEALIRWRHQVENVADLEAAMRLVGAGRVDATLLFGEQYAYLRDKDPGLPELVSAAVRGTPPNEVRLSCTRGDVGDRLVAVMESAMDAELRGEILAAYRAMLPPDLVVAHQRMIDGGGPAVTGTSP
ncbi:MAG: hypothetical protein RLY86_3364 [Pseudomonadota bacterium]|jgi:uncharacterized protein (TIGR02285 family)